MHLAPAELRPEYRQAFVLFHEQELSYAEIATAMEVPLGTIKTWVHRARREMIDYLRRRGESPKSGRKIQDKKYGKPNAMHCREFEQRLDAILDDRRSPTADPRLRDHASHCLRCRELLNDQATLLAGFSQRTAPQPGRDFARRVVLASIAPAYRKHPSRRAWFAAAAALASAAAMLMAVSLVWYARYATPHVVARPASSSRPMVSARPRSRGFSVAQPALSQRRLPAPRSAAITGADLLLEAPGLPGRLNYRGAIDELVTVLPEAGYRLEQMEHVAPGLRPLRMSLSAIWETLCRTIPGSHQDSPSKPPRRTSNWWLEPIRVA